MHALEKHGFIMDFIHSIRKLSHISNMTEFEIQPPRKIVQAVIYGPAS